MEFPQSKLQMSKDFWHIGPKCGLVYSWKLCCSKVLIPRQACCDDVGDVSRSCCTRECMERSSESHSNITSWSPTSSAIKIPSSIALTSASSGPSGTQSSLLMAAMTCPSWSRATTPIPVACVCLKTAPSVFILYQGLFGGDHWWCVVQWEAGTCD